MKVKVLRLLVLPVTIALVAAYYVGYKNGLVYGVIMFPIVATTIFYFSFCLQTKGETSKKVERVSSTASK